MGLIRVSDDAETKIKALSASSGRTVTSTVDTLLQSNDVAARLDKMGKWLQKKFDDLEAALDGAVLTAPKTNRVKQNVIEWPVVQELMFDVLPEGDAAWYPGKEEMARASSDMDFGVFYTDGEKIYSDDMWGHTDWLKCTATVLAFLTSKGVL